MKILEYIQSLKLPRNTSKRFDCICGGKHTLSVTNDNGRLLWLCFRNSCKLKGKHSTDISMEDIKDTDQKKETKTLPLKDTLGWVSPTVDERAEGYLKKYNCFEAYNEYPYKFFYDRLKERLVFVEHTQLNVFSLAVGRTLVGATPKTYNYIRLPHTYFTVPSIDGTDKVVYISEDCASACSLSRVGHAIALCGTMWDTLSLAALCERFVNKGNVVICLDKDAELTALSLKRDLEGFGKFNSITIARLSDDAKRLSLDILKKELKL